MAVIGEDLGEKLREQIQIRQKKLGKTLLDTEDIVFSNSNTSWIRAASSVDIVKNNVEATGLQNLGIVGNDEKGDYAAKHGVLFGGIATKDLTGPIQAFSDGYSLEQQAIGAYGWGGNNDKWGYSPPPALQSLTIKALNRGAIRKAELSIIAHNPDQFRLIDTLYMRLGFTILVEWGHSIYYNNDGILEKRPNYNTRPFDYFMGNIPPSGKTEIDYLLQGLNEYEKRGNYLEDPWVLKEQDDTPSEAPPSTFNSIAREIEKEKELRNFNYGGFIGYVSNYNWNFNSDGTYTINVSVITKGGLIDSLTLNHPSFSNKSGKQGHSHVLSVEIDDWERAANSGSLGLEANNTSYITYNAASEYERYNNSQGEIFENLFSQDAELVKIAFVQNTSKIYCTLGLLLKTIEQKCLFYTKDFNPIINIDNKYGSSFMLSHPFQGSIDPGVCVVSCETPTIRVEKAQTNTTTTTKTLPKTGILKGIDNDLFRTDNPFKADIMGILVNTQYIKDTFNNSLKDGTVSLNKFLENLLEGINVALGSLNNFHLSYDDTTNTYSIHDDNTIPGTVTENKAIGKINIYSRKNKKNSDRDTVDLGSFVKDVSVSSKMFPNIQNLVAIAAQNPNEGTIGEKVGSFQRLNRGLIDRTSDGTMTPAEEVNTNVETVPYDKYRQAIFNISSFFRSTYVNFQYPEQQNINDLKSSYPKVLTGDLQWRAKENEITPPFFMPIEISLTMHGLSGFKLFQKFDVGPDFIFPSYIPDNLNYIIQGITHDLKGNEWTTTLNTLCWMAKNAPKEEKITPLELPIVGCPQQETSSPTPSPPSPSPIEEEPSPEETPTPEEESTTPNADRLRTVLSSFGYTEKGSEISNAGDITSTMADYAISVFTQIKQQTSISIKVTGGRDQWHKNNAPYSRHNKGRGLDFVITPVTQENIDKIEKILKGFAAGNYDLARYLNEYANPTKKATAKHFHISYGKGTEADTNIATAKQEADDGLIPTYSIT